MVNGLLGKKIGMTQLLDNDGSIVPVTVIQAGPCVVVQKKTKPKDGYDAVQLGFVEFVKPKRVNKPMTGHFKKANVAPVKFVREMAVQDGNGANPGDKVMVDIFAKDELVHIIGTSKGRVWPDTWEMLASRCRTCVWRASIRRTIFSLCAEQCQDRQVHMWSWRSQGDRGREFRIAYLDLRNA